MVNSGLDSGLGKVQSVKDLIGQLTEFECGLWIKLQYCMMLKFVILILITVLWLFKIKPLFLGNILKYLEVKKTNHFQMIQKNRTNTKNDSENVAKYLTLWI